MKRLVLAVLCGLSLTACAQPAEPQAAGTAAPAESPALAEPTFAAGTPEATVRNALRELNPRVVVEHVGPAPLKGFREVVAGGQVLYVSDDGKYLFQGGLLDLANRQDMTEVAMAKVRKNVLATLPQEDRIVFAPQGATKHTVVVLTDIECGYCRKFHEDIAKYNAQGIRVEYLAFPRAGLGSEDYRKMVSVWCADDRRKALTDAKSGRAVKTQTCARTPVDMQYRAGQRMGLEGTPMILSPNGDMLGGYLPPEALLQQLEALAKPAAG